MTAEGPPVDYFQPHSLNKLFLKAFFVMMTTMTTKNVETTNRNDDGCDVKTSRNIVWEVLLRFIETWCESKFCEHVCTFQNWPQGSMWHFGLSQICFELGTGCCQLLSSSESQSAQSNIYTNAGETRSNTSSFSVNIDNLFAFGYILIVEYFLFSHERQGSIYKFWQQVGKMKRQRSILQY